MKAAYGAGTAQESLCGWMRWRWAAGVICGVLAVESDSLEDEVRKATFRLVQRGLDVCIMC